MENPFEFQGFTMTMCHPTLLPQVFKYIEPGLLEIQRKAKLEWDIMVIPTLINANQATLAMMHREHDGQERHAGFVVTQSVFLGVPSKHYMKILASYVERWVHEAGFDGVAAHIAFAHEWGKQLGCHAVIESATRPGWVRRLKKLNFETVEETMMRIIEV